jgi:hypothetical protein
LLIAVGFRTLGPNDIDEGGLLAACCRGAYTRTRSTPGALCGIEGRLDWWQAKTKGNSAQNFVLTVSGRYFDWFFYCQILLATHQQH